MEGLAGMILKYTKPNGSLIEVALSDKPVTIGRSPKADIVLEDEKASRIHCGIRLDGSEFLLKDLASKNGTFLNNERVDSTPLTVGDKIRVGNTVFTLEKESAKGATTAFQEMEKQMSGGKGYDTILKEIVGESKKTR